MDSDLKARWAVQREKRLDAEPAAVRQNDGVLLLDSTEAGLV